MKTLHENFIKLYSSIKNNEYNKNRSKEIFELFYKNYLKVMEYFKEGLNLLRSVKNKQNSIDQIKNLQKIYNEKKKEIDKKLVSLGNNNDYSNLLNISSIIGKKEANKIQIETENENNNLSGNSINKISNDLQNYYDLILKDEKPIKEYFEKFYRLYIKLMKELDRIIYPISKKAIDKIKIGLIAKKLKIDDLLINSNFSNLKNKNITNLITPKNLKIENSNKIIFPHPPQNNSKGESKKISKVNYKNENSKISRLEALQFKRMVSELSPNENAELRELSINKNKINNNNLASLINNLSLSKKTNNPSISASQSA